MIITQSINGVVEERTATVEEEKAILAAQKESQEQLNIEKKELDAILAAKESGRAKLSALGLTNDEIMALLG
jgi:hypothetical protein